MVFVLIFMFICLCVCVCVCICTEAGHIWGHRRRIVVGLFSRNVAEWEIRKWAYIRTALTNGSGGASID